MTEWHNLKTSILQQDDKSTEVSVQHFEKVEVLMKNRKNRKIVKRLKAVSTQAKLSFMTEFLEKRLSRIIHHRNQLKHYRSCLSLFKENIIGAYIDENFSGNLSLPVKYELQDLHWSQEQITVHSGVLKFKGENSYHRYLSAKRRHDQHFAQLCILEILKKS